MSWPLSQDYNEAIQDPASSFADPELRRGEPATNAMGLPLPRSGNFADVYEFTCPATNSKWAVKCFTRHVAGQGERYAAISRHLEQAKLPFMVDFQYLQQGIRVQGKWYPILKMRWIEGLLLNAFIRDYLDKPALLQALSQIWLRMAKRLREARVAHADLQHGNVILVPGSKMTSLAVKLIDYDGMWVPALAGKNSGEVGHPNFQHPQRLRDGTYNAEVDRFPELVVATALRALALGGRDLWERHDNGENLLFKETDLRAPAESALFAELRGRGDPLLTNLVGQLQKAAAAGRLEATPLLEGLVPEEKSAKGKVAADGVDWTFVEDERPRPQQRQKKRGVPVWAWAAAAAVLVAGLGGAFFALRSGDDDKTKQVAQNPTPKAAPTTAKTGPKEPAEKTPVDPPRPDLDKRSVDPRPADPPRPDPVKPPVGVQPPRLAGRPEGAFAYANAPSGGLLVVAAPASTSWDVIDMASKQKLRTFMGHKGPVTCVALTADGRRALSGSEDRTLRWWDVETGETLKVLEGHEQGVIAVALSPDGRRAASADLGPNVRLWDLDAGKEVRRLNHRSGIASVAFSADGKHVATGAGQPVPGNKYPIMRWNAESGQPEQGWHGPEHPVLCLAFQADGNRVLSGSIDEPISTWTVGQPDGFPAYGGLRGPVHQVAVSPSGNILVASSGARAQFWNMNAGKAFSRGQGGADVVAAFFQPDGSVRWVSRNGTQISWSVIPDPEKSAALAANTPPPKPPTPPPTPPSPPRDNRQPVPDREALAAAAKEVEDLLKDRPNSGSRRTNLFNLGVGGGNLSPAVRYAALKECRDQSARDGDIRFALQAVNEMVRRFLVNRREARAEAITVAARSAHTTFQNQAVAEQALRLAGEARADDDYDLLSRLALLAREAAVKGQGKPALVEAAEHLQKEVTEVKRELAAFKEALGVLAREPDNAAANFKAGAFRIVHQDNWEEGLPLLARGSNEALKGLAKKDLADPADASARKEMGDRWWEAALKEKEKSPARRALFRRAHYWYELALPKLTMGQAEVNSRMKIVGKMMPELLDPWRHVDVSEGTFKTDYIHLDKSRCLFTRRSYKGGVDVTVEARTEDNNIRLTAGAGGRVIFNHENAPGGMVFDRPDNPGVDGRGFNGGSIAGTEARSLDANKWYTLRWQLTPTGMKVWVNDVLIFEKAETYDLSDPRPVGVCAFFQNGIDVRKVVVKAIPEVPAAKD